MKLFEKRYHPPGTGPGTLRVADKIPEDAYRIYLIDYTADSLQENADATAEQCQASLTLETRTWVHVQGSITPATLTRLGDLFTLHALALEDVLNVGQRPKVDVHEDHLFVVLALPLWSDTEIGISQVSLFLGKDYLITFCSGDHDPFEPLRARLRKHQGKLRTLELDYLMYAAFDVVIDEAYPILEMIGNRIESLEDAVLTQPDNAALNGIHVTKRELLLLRRMLWPHREVINTVLRDDEKWIADLTKIYLRDCYDHVVQIMDLVDNYREMASGLLEVYLSSVSNRLNDVMRVLTIFATIFIPLSFLVGVYGMNFSNETSPWAMPELRWYYGYPLLWLMMLTVVATMLYLFKRKNWF